MRVLLPFLLVISACGGGGGGPPLGFARLTGQLTLLSMAPQRIAPATARRPQNIATARVVRDDPQGSIGAGELAVFRYVADAPRTLSARLHSDTVEGDAVLHDLETGAVSRTLTIAAGTVYDVVVSGVRGAFTVSLEEAGGSTEPASLPDGYLELGDGHAPGEIVALPRPGFTAADMGAELGADVVEGVEGGRGPSLLRLRGAPRDDALRELCRVLCCCAKLEAGRFARYAEPNFYRRLAQTPNDPRLGEQWGLAQTRVRAAWTLTTGSSGVIVGVVDSGVRANHPDLAGRLLPGYDFVGGDTDPNDPAQDIAHGTSTASIIAASTNDGVGMAGVNWSARIIPVRSFDEGGFGTSFRIAQGIRFAAGLPNSSGTTPAQGADLINLSFASKTPTVAEEDACDDARAADILLVAATGNDGDIQQYYPAAYPSVMACTATNADGQFASYSNHGNYVRICAPGGSGALGVLVASYNNGGVTYATPNGTSFACPYVIGIAALVLGVADLSADQLQQLIEDTAQDIGTVGYDIRTGAGIVDAYAAVLSALGQNPPALIPGEVIEVRLVQVATGKTVFLAETTQSQSLAFDFPQVGTGEYFLIAGTDRDFDGSVDDFGEVTGQWSNGQGSTIVSVLPNSDITNLDFTIAPK